MSSRRVAKAAEAIRETVSSTILFELRDPRVQHVTVLGAEPAPDLRTAKVFISVMGDPKQQSLCMHGLESARGFIQAKLADRLQTKYTPVLKFVLDPAVKKSTETSRAIRAALATSPAVADQFIDEYATAEHATAESAEDDEDADPATPDDRDSNDADSIES
jgi:ribosome-binding factor A